MEANQQENDDSSALDEAIHNKKDDFYDSEIN
jgi:hypothetical protein